MKQLFNHKEDVVLDDYDKKTAPRKKKWYWAISCSCGEIFVVSSKKMYEGDRAYGGDLLSLKHAEKRVYKNGDALICKNNNPAVRYDRVSDATWKKLVKQRK